MAGVVQIADMKSNGALSFDLADMVEMLREVGPTLAWSVPDLGDAIGKADKCRKLNISVVETDEMAHSALGGMALSWDELVSLGQCIFQTIDGPFCRSQERGLIVSSFIRSC